MEMHRSYTIYKTYLICICLLLLCFVITMFLRERNIIELNFSKWDPTKVSLEDIGFTGERFSKPGSINRQIISWEKQKYLVVFTHSDINGAGMFIYGSNTFGQTQLKGMLLLSNGADELIIDKVPNIIKVIDINGDNNPELIIDIGQYTDFYEQYTVISYNPFKQELTWNNWLDKDSVSGEMVNKGHIVFINGETDMGNMNFEISDQKHTVRVYQGIAPEKPDGEWEWKSVIYELIGNKFVFKTME